MAGGSRGRGERLVQEAFPGASIVRPSVMFGPGDALFGTVATTRALEHAYMRMAEQTRSGARQSFRVDAEAG